MFFSKARRINELEEQLADVMDQRDDLRERLKSGEYDRFNLVYEELQKSSFSFDWAWGRAFSIERIHEWNEDQKIYLATTVIGYLAPDPTEDDKDKLKVGQWCFYCSAEEHTRLVEEFNEYKAKRK